jgi:hypothetical protein
MMARLYEGISMFIFPFANALNNAQPNAPQGITALKY